MRTAIIAVMVGCTFGTAGDQQEKSRPGADRLLQQCTKILKYGDRNGFDKPAKDDAVIALGLLADDRAVPLLLDHLENETEGQLQYQIIRALGWIKSTKAVPALEKFLRHKDLSRRDVATLALEAITGKDYGSQARFRRPLEPPQNLLPNPDAGGPGGRKAEPARPALEVGKAYRFLFARADVKDVVAVLTDGPREGWAKVRATPGDAVTWINLGAVVMIVPAEMK